MASFRRTGPGWRAHSTQWTGPMATWRCRCHVVSMPCGAGYAIFHVCWWVGYGSIPIDTFLMGWTSIYQLFWGSLGTRVLTHSQLFCWISSGKRSGHMPMFLALQAQFWITSTTGAGNDSLCLVERLERPMTEDTIVLTHHTQLILASLFSSNMDCSDPDVKASS